LKGNRSIGSRSMQQVLVVRSAGNNRLATGSMKYTNIALCILYCIVQKGTNQNGVFEFIGKEISVQPTLTPSRGLKNCFFTIKHFLHNIISMLITCVPNLKDNKFTKKRYSKSTNMCSCEKNFTIAHFDTLPRAKKLFI